MTLQWIGLAAAWLASGYRLWVSLRQPATLWRTSFTVGIVCAAIGVTLQSFSPQIDALTAPSVGSLLNHLFIIVGLASVQVYVATLRRDSPPSGLLRRVVLVAVAAEAVTVVSWIFAAPFHSGEAEHFAELATLGVEIVLLGTGARQRFPHARLTAPLGAAHVGLEVMDSKAACRTYNILVAEERRVALALLFG